MVNLLRNLIVAEMHLQKLVLTQPAFIRLLINDCIEKQLEAIYGGIKMKELNKLFINIGSICLSVWVMAQVISNPTTVGTISGWLCVVFIVLAIITGQFDNK